MAASGLKVFTVAGSSESNIFGEFVELMLKYVDVVASTYVVGRTNHVAAHVVTSNNLIGRRFASPPEVRPQASSSPHSTGL